MQQADKKVEAVYISKILTSLLEQKKTISLLADKLIDLEDKVQSNSNALSNYVQDLNNYINQVTTFINKVETLTSLVNTSISSIDSLLLSKDGKKSLVERFERVEDWVIDERNRVTKTNEEKKKFFTDVLSNLVPTITLIIVTFMGGVLFEYFVNYSNRVRVNPQVPIVSPDNPLTR